MSGKSKGRSFEREIYKILRDSKLFKKVNLTLGSGSTDELSDINVTTLDGYIWIFELKTGDRKYLTETNFNKWWKKLKDECQEEEYPILIYREDYKPIMVMTEILSPFNNEKIRVRLEFDSWFNQVTLRYKPKEG